VPYAREQIVGIAKVLRRYPWMVELVGQGPVCLIGLYAVEAYVARDGAEACISFGGAYCSGDEGVSVRRLKLEFRGLSPRRRSKGGVRPRASSPSREPRNTCGYCKARPRERRLKLRLGKAGFFPPPFPLRPKLLTKRS
jgi:hypothetical protein